jgi:ubiquitin C-terminal hydrolase
MHNFKIPSYNKRMIKNGSSNISYKIVEELTGLFKLMWSKNMVINPKKFLSILKQIAISKGNCIFNNNTQEDVSELIFFIFDCIIDACGVPVKVEITGKLRTKQDIIAKKCYDMIKQTYTKSYTKLFNVFYGIQVSLINGIQQPTEQIVPEIFLTCNLDIYSNDKSYNKIISIYDCFDFYTKKDIIDYKINDGTYVNHTKQYMFWSLPEILIIILKRFTNDNNKINTIVNFPINDELNLNKYCLGYRKQNIYSLYGVCNHSGSTSGGHYTSFVKNKDNQEWFHYNDCIVTHIPNSNINSIISNKSYCLFYKHIK